MPFRKEITIQILEFIFLYLPVHKNLRQNQRQLYNVVQQKIYDNQQFNQDFKIYQAQKRKRQFDTIPNQEESLNSYNKQNQQKQNNKIKKNEDDDDIENLIQNLFDQNNIKKQSEYEDFNLLKKYLSNKKVATQNLKFLNPLIIYRLPYEMYMHIKSDKDGQHYVFDNEYCNENPYTKYDSQQIINLEQNSKTIFIKFRSLINDQYVNELRYLEQKCRFQGDRLFKDFGEGLKSVLQTKYQLMQNDQNQQNSLNNLINIKLQENLNKSIKIVVFDLTQGGALNLKYLYLSEKYLNKRQYDIQEYQEKIENKKGLIQINQYHNLEDAMQIVNKQGFFFQILANQKYFTYKHDQKLVDRALTKSQQEQLVFYEFELIRIENYVLIIHCEL